MPPVEGSLADAVSPVSDSSRKEPSLGKRQGHPFGSPSSLSSTSTADDAELSSPVLPALPAPLLPERAQEYLRTPASPSEAGQQDGRYVTTSWGSPYQQGEARHFRHVSFSSEISEDEEDSELSLPHQLEVSTRFLRPAPSAQPSPEIATPSSLTGTAAVLANRARRPVLGITEDWIRTHTTDDPETEYRHWLSDTDESEHSLLSGSHTPDEVPWVDDLQTPRAQIRFAESTLSPSQRHQRARSSNETLKQALTNNASRRTMEAWEVDAVLAASADSLNVESPMEAANPISPVLEEFSKAPEMAQESPRPATPPRTIRQVPASTPRIKKKVPWRGKNIMVLIPRDEERGKLGKAPKPMTSDNVKTMLRDWEELGYNVRGFDLDATPSYLEPSKETSQSRGQWPAQEDVTEERSKHSYQVTLPDLDAWKRYQDDLLEEKLRKLGVSLGGDDEPTPPPQSISPAISNLSRQASFQYPPLPFSPPVPTDSAASNGQPAFPFPGSFLSGSSAAQSPGISSPVSFNGRHLHGNGKYNPRASIAISPHELPFFSGQPSPAWSPQMFLQNQLGRTGSPSMLNMNALASPHSPFQRDGMSPAMNLHHRHQSLQFPMLPHQQLQRVDSARASPSLHALQEEEEEIQSNPYEGKSPSKTPEPQHYIRHNASDSLQKEIDDAEYHLEEQFRSQLEEPDYSPHKESNAPKLPSELETSAEQEPVQNHARGPSVHFGNFGTDSDEGPKLHHPRPHSRGHSLTQKAFFDTEEVRDSADEGVTKATTLDKIDLELPTHKYEVETNPSNPGTPLQALDLVNKMHERTVSTTSNPWANETSGNTVDHSRHASHASKPSLSKLNAGAAEFKFNPASTFIPGQGSFNFGSSSNIVQATPAFPTFTPGAPTFKPSAPVFKPSAPAFQPGVANFTPGAPSFQPTAAVFTHSKVPSLATSSKAQSEKSQPLFSPGRSTFDFSSSGPSFNPAASSFNPGAAAFTPIGSFAASISSQAASGTDGPHTRTGSIFGPINLDLSNATKAANNKSKAVPIVRPSSARRSKSPTPARSPSPTFVDDKDGRPTDTSRLKKKFRDNNDDGDDVPLFAEPTPEPEKAPTPEEESLPQQESESEAEPRASIEVDITDQLEVAGDEKAEDDENSHMADITLASTVLSESTDDKVQSDANGTKATSPSATPDLAGKPSWTPFEFRSEHDMQDFASARPFGDEEPTIDHKKNLSAAAPAFVPGEFKFGAANQTETPFDPSLDGGVAQISQDDDASEDDLEDERAGSPTPGPDFFTRPEQTPSPVSKTASIGLGMSRFASPPPAPTNKGLGASRFAQSPSPEQSPSPPPRPSGLAASRFADVSSPVSEEAIPVRLGTDSPQRFESLPVRPPSVDTVNDEELQAEQTEDATFEEIDAVMRYMNENPNMGIKRTVGAPDWQPEADHHAAPVSHLPLLMQPQLPFPGADPIPSPRQYLGLPDAPLPSAELDDPFVDAPRSAISQTFDGHAPVHHLNAGGSVQDSEWDDAFSADEQDKLEQRSNYFDSHVTELVGNLLASRLGPLEKSLGLIESAIGRNQSKRRSRRSVSADVQESDADDEDDDMPAHRSLSPRRDKKMEQIRMAVTEAFNAQIVSRALQPAQLEAVPEAAKGDSEILRAIEEMKQQISEPLRLDFRGDDLRSIVEEAVTSKLPPPAPTVIKDDEEANAAMAEMQAKMHDLSQRLRDEEERSHRERARVAELEDKLRADEVKREEENASRHAAEDRSAELRRQLDQAETKLEVEIMNRNIYDQRAHDLEDRLKAQEQRNETELVGRREAEDRLSEIQRLLRISSEEEDRLRSVLDERNNRIKSIEQSSGKTSMRLTLLEGAQKNAEKTENELKNRLNITETELRDSRQEARHWRAEAERERQSSIRYAEEHSQVATEVKHLHKLIDTLGVQLEENEKIRDNWRTKFVALQDDMAHAAREITEENSRRAKEKQSIVARMEVLDARLQAEARTRERLEVEVERLEGGERAGMRAVSECKRLEGLLSELRNENHGLHQNVLHLQREVQEARDSGASEVQRTRMSLQGEIDAANHQVNVVRMELDDEASRLRSQLDQIKLDADTANARHEMMLEEAQTSKNTDIEQLTAKHQSEVEDLLAKHERQLNNATEDAQQTEQNLLERLSLSKSKTEHLQDRISHLEDKVQVAQEAARAAAQHASQAKSAPVQSAPMQIALSQPGPVGQTKQLAEAMQLPEKISPQALRESIMVLQEQLQARETRIEELESEVEQLDPEAATKISKRDDEITWLRELLAVRHGDLQDIIQALSAERFNREAVKDAAIRLKANLQMEEQERERAMNGGSAINLPSIAATFRDAATPRVAQAVGPLAAAWGSWRKASQQSVSRNSSFSSARPSSGVGRNSTPSKPRSDSQNSLLSGLMTPPASHVRSTPAAPGADAQPTAFGNTGRRLTAEQFANRSHGSSMTTRQAEKMPMVSTPPARAQVLPSTPPMMRSTGYDQDAQMEDFDDAAFFDD